MQNNIGLFVAKRAAMAPDSPALFDLASDRRFTYRELDEACNRTANDLVAAGLQKGTALRRS